MQKKDKVMVLVAVMTGVTTVALSMVLNVWAFTVTLGGWFGTTVGVLLPLWVLALTLAGQHATSRTGKEKIGYAAYGLAGFLLLVSMPHLATGYGKLGLAWCESWSLALLTDLTQVIMIALTKPAEVATAARRPRRRRRRPAPAVDSATTMWSRLRREDVKSTISQWLAGGDRRRIQVGSSFRILPHR